MSYRLPILLLTATLVACGSSAQGPSGPADGTATSLCEGAAPAPGVSSVSLEHDGNQRAYRLFVPSGYRHEEGTPLVLNFHGTGGNAEGLAAYSEMDQAAEARGVLVAYPEGLPLGGGQVFDAGLRNFSERPRDDVDFARTVVDDVASRACVDRRKVYATGMSNGGRMSYRIACEAADLVAAIAPVAGVLSLPAEECQPQRPVPALHFHGTTDVVAPYDRAGGFSTMSVPDMFALWAEKTACTGEPETTFAGNGVRCEAYLSCGESAEVELCTIEGFGHCWPGFAGCPADPSVDVIDASEAMLDFMLRFELG